MIKLFGLRIYTKSDFIKAQVEDITYYITKDTYNYTQHLLYLVKSDLSDIVKDIKSIESKKVKK